MAILLREHVGGKSRSAHGYLIVRDGQPDKNELWMGWRERCRAAGQPAIVVRITPSGHIVYFDWSSTANPLDRPASAEVRRAFDCAALKIPGTGESVVCDHARGLYGLVPTESVARRLAQQIVDIAERDQRDKTSARQLAVSFGPHTAGQVS